MTTWHDVDVPKTIAKDAQEKAETALASAGLGDIPLNNFKTITVSGQPDVVADSIGDTLHLVAGTNIAITTDAGSDTITFNAPADAGTSSFGTISVSGQSDVVADAAPDGLTLVGTGITITTNATTDTITLAPTYGTITGTVCQGDDFRLSNARVPTAHATSHKSGQTDEIKLDELGAPSDTTALNASTTAHGLQLKLTGDATDYSNGAGGWSKPSGMESFSKIATPGQSDITANTPHATLTVTGSTGIILTTNLTSGLVNWSLNFGSASGTVCQGNDARLSNSRVPTTHAASHKLGGTDPIRLDEFDTPLDNTNLNATASRHGLLLKLPGDATKFLNGTGSWQILPSRYFSSVKDFGAVGDGFADDTSCINAAISAMPASGGRLYFPAGAYRFISTLTFNKPGVYFGDGSATALKCDFASSTAIDISSGFVEFSNFSMSHNVTRADSQISVRCRGTNISVYRFLMTGFSIGFTVEGTSSTIEHGAMFSGKPGTGIGIWVSNNPFDISIWDILINSDPNIGVGIRITESGDVEMGRLSIIHCDYGLDIIPSVGQTVASVWAVNSFFDNCGDNAARVYAINSGGNIIRLLFSQCWFSSAGGTGLHMLSTSGLISGAAFTGCHFFLNAAGGALIEGANTNGIRFGNSIFAQNGASAGMWFENGVNKFVVNACCSGPNDALSGNGYGLIIAGTSHNEYIVTSNNLIGNTINNFADVGTGPNKVVANNLF